MNRKNKSKVKVVTKTVGDAAIEAVKDQVQVEVQKPSFWSKIFKGVKFAVVLLVKSGLWKKFGVAKYWQNLGIILALVGVTYNAVETQSTIPTAISEAISTYAEIDSIMKADSVENAELKLFYEVKLDSIQGELVKAKSENDANTKVLNDFKGAIKIVK